MTRSAWLGAVLMVLLAAGLRAEPSAPVPFTVRTWPSDARIYQETSLGECFLGLSNRTIMLNLDQVGDMVYFRVRRNGCRDVEVQVTRYRIEHDHQYPPDKDPPLHLDALNPLWYAWIVVGEHPLAAVGAGVLCAAGVAAFLVRRRQTRRLLQRASVLDSMIVTRDTLIEGSMIGRSIGGYKLLSVLGRGGMASVYRACKDEDLENAAREEVALKLMRSEMAANPELMKRFQREIRVCSTLDHPGIVRILDYGNEDGVPYLVMELVAGETLRTWLGERDRCTVHEVAEMLLPVVRAVQYAHEKGVVHRDLKPENIMILNSRHQVKVMDFGLVQVEGTRMTETGTSLGTPAYMSPEQITAPRIDGRSDQYSLGVTAYEMLTGKVPFDDDVAINILFKHLQQDPTPVRELRPDCPADLDALVMRMLAKDPNDRYPDLKAVADALQKLL